MFHSKREYFFLTYLIGITCNAVAVAHEVTAAAVLRLHPIVDRVSVHQASTLLSTLTIPLAALSDTAFNSCRLRRCLHSHSCCCPMTHHPLFLHPSSARWNLLRPSILPIEVFSLALIFKLSQCHMLGLLHHSLTHCLLLLPLLLLLLLLLCDAGADLRTASTSTLLLSLAEYYAC